MVNFNFAEPIKKRSKLVLPAPQISDAELDQVVKIGKMNVNVLAELDNGDEVSASQQLLSDYSITSNSALDDLRTPRQSTYSREALMAEAKNLIALTNTETPLKGGENAPIVEVEGFTSSNLATPGYKTNKVAATPNLVLSTPFRTPASRNQNIKATPAGNFTPASVRDNLSINPEESLALQILDQKKLIKENRSRIRQVLSELPEPKREYELNEIEDDEEEQSRREDQTVMELDQADVDSNLQKGIEDDLEYIKRKQTLAVQRQLPRPQEIVDNLILQPATANQELNELQKSDLLIKQEILNLLKFDLYKNPTDEQLIIRSKKRTELKPVELDKLSEKDINKAKELLEEEVKQLKSANEKELSIDEYNEIWNECWSQLCYLENDNRYTILNLMDKKAKLDAFSYMLNKNKEHMNKEAKKANKFEKKLKVLLGGYQSRFQNLNNQLITESNELENLIIELNTFKKLKESEEQAITKRVGSVMSDVKRQIMREKELQKKYDELKRKKDELLGITNNNNNLINDE